MGVPLCGGHWELGGVRLLGILRDRAPEREHLCLRELC